VKLVLALHLSDHEQLRTDGRLSPALRAGLAAAGATQVQVNVDDADVAPAQLRLATGTQITAVVMLRGDDLDVGAALDAVRAVDPTAVGWSVEERSPLPPPEVLDGVRADALANIAFLRRPVEMSYDAWRSEWLDRHTQVAIDTQATFGYVQDRVLEALTPDTPPVAGIVEELFPMAAMTDLHAFYGTGGDDAELRRRLTAMLDSVGRFGADRHLDLLPTSRYCYWL
jgi:hypothetical protein